MKHIAIDVAARSKFANLVRDLSRFLKLWVVAKCLEVVGVFNLQDALNIGLVVSFLS